MKILIFSTYFYPYISGAVKLPWFLSKYLADKKNEVTVLTFKYNKKLKSIDKVDNVKIERVDYLIKISKGFISPQLILRSVSLIKKTDIVILNLPNFEGIIIAVISCLYGKKLIGMFNCWVDLGKGLYLGIINQIINFSIKIQLKLCSQIVPTTFDYAKCYLKEFMNKINVSISPPVIQNPVSLDYLDKLRADKNGFFVIGFIGRLAREKGLEYLLTALENLKDEKILLLIAGPSGLEVVGENKYYAKIVKLLEEGQVKYKVLGKLSEEELGAFYSTIDLLVLPSVNKTEAFGLVQAEAMLFGKPVIASNLPGVRIPIEETGMGILVEPKNAGEIEKAILKIRTNYLEYTNKERFRKARDLFNINNFYHNWSRLLNI